MDTSRTDSYGNLNYKWVAGWNANQVFQLEQSALLDYYGIGAGGELLAPPITLRATNEVSGYFHWQVISGPAQVQDPISGNWGALAEYTLASDLVPGVYVRAIDKSGGLNDIQIRLKWAPWGPPYGNPSEAVEIITWKMTAFAPKMIPLAENEPPGPIEDRASRFGGYESLHNYWVVHEVDEGAVWVNFPVNEMRGDRVDKLPNYWPTIDMENTTTNHLGRFSDMLGYWGTLNPQPLPPGCSQNPSVVQYSNHVWRGGSITSGYGITLETPKTMDYHICNARRL